MFQIATLAEGKPWSEETSPAQNYVPHKTSSSGGLKVVNKNGSATAVKSSPLDLDKDSLEDFLNRLVVDDVVRNFPYVMFEI